MSRQKPPKIMEKQKKYHQIPEMKEENNNKIECPKTGMTTGSRKQATGFLTSHTEE